MFENAYMFAISQTASARSMCVGGQYAIMFQPISHRRETASSLAKVATTKTFTPGRRVAPVDKRKDADAQLRVNAGEKIGDKQNFVLQVNSQAKNTALKKFVAKNGRGTHAQLATASFDTKAADPEAEARRVVEEMREQSKKKVG
jgi:hypothetical protein